MAARNRTCALCLTPITQKEMDAGMYIRSAFTGNYYHGAARKLERCLALSRKRESEPAMNGTRPAIELRPGDTFRRDNVIVKVVGQREPCSDRFGRSLFRFMCERQDTKEQGYCTFGPLGQVLRG